MNTDDPRLATLHERRAFLLRSLDDLDREHAAGDMSDADFDLLHNDYSRRAAGVLREIEGETLPAVASTSKPSPRLGKKLVVGSFIGAVAVGAGLLVRSVAGERKGSDGLTGTINAAQANNLDAKVQALLQKGRDSLTSDPFGALQSFDQAAALDPTQAEALAYGGWVLRLVSVSVEDATKKSELVNGALARLNKAIEVAPRYPDARAFRGVLLLRDKNDPKAALSDFVALEALNPPAEIQQLVTGARQDAEAAAAKVG